MRQRVFVLHSADLISARYNMNKKIEQLIATLNLIEVHGKENLDMLLGCILTLEQMKKDGEVDGGQIDK